jgi:hypothetical protein
VLWLIAAKYQGQPLRHINYREIPKDNSDALSFPSSGHVRCSTFWPSARLLATWQGSSTLCVLTNAEFWFFVTHLQDITYCTTCRAAFMNGGFCEFEVESCKRRRGLWTRLVKGVNSAVAAIHAKPLQEHPGGDRKFSA